MQLEKGIKLKSIIIKNKEYTYEVSIMWKRCYITAETSWNQ